MNPANAWKQSGHISLRRYAENERNCPGWPLNADAAECRSFASLPDALAADGSGSRTLRLTSPTVAPPQVPNNRGGRARWLAPARLRVTLSKSRSEWLFPSSLDPATIAMGRNWLWALREGLVDRRSQGRPSPALVLALSGESPAIHRSRRRFAGRLDSGVGASDG